VLRQSETIPTRVDIRSRARRGPSARAWLAVFVVALAGIVILGWAFRVMLEDLDGRSVGPPLIAVGGFLLVLAPMILAWFALGRVLRLRRAESTWPGSFVVPFVITRQLPRQVDRVASALGTRLYVPSTGYGLLVADAAGTRILSGWGLATHLAIPRASLGAVELGEIQFPLGTATSVDVVLKAPSEERISFMAIRTDRLLFRNERTEIIGQYVEALRNILQLGSSSQTGRRPQG
jgi:hypothetical protein